MLALGQILPDTMSMADINCQIWAKDLPPVHIGTETAEIYTTNGEGMIYTWKNVFFVYFDPTNLSVKFLLIYINFFLFWWLGKGKEGWMSDLLKLDTACYKLL